MVWFLVFTPYKLLASVIVYKLSFCKFSLFFISERNCSSRSTLTCILFYFKVSCIKLLGFLASRSFVFFFVSFLFLRNSSVHVFALALATHGRKTWSHACMVDYSTSPFWCISYASFKIHLITWCIIYASFLVLFSHLVSDIVLNNFQMFGLLTSWRSISLFPLNRFRQTTSSSLVKGKLSIWAIV